MGDLNEEQEAPLILQSDDQNKIQTPDPDIESENENEVKSVTTELDDTLPGESMIEGAWADILGSGQLKKKIVKKGKNNSRPVGTDICTIRLYGKLIDGAPVDVHDELAFQLGDSEVIHGIDLVVALMNEGEICEMEVAPRFAYGSLGRTPDIPSDATIHYVIELLSVAKEPFLETISVEERLKTGNKKRERGNWWYSREDYTRAVQCYRKALDYLDTENENESDSPERLQEVLEDRLKVYNNLAAAQLKIEAFDAALKSLENVLMCQPNNVKALYRKAKVLITLGRSGEAVAQFDRALKVDPDNRTIHAELTRLQAQIRQESLKEKSLYKKMFGLDKPSAPAATSPLKEGKIKLTVPWTMMLGAVTAFVASYLTYRYKFG